MMGRNADAKVKGQRSSSRMDVFRQNEVVPKNPRVKSRRGEKKMQLHLRENTKQIWERVIPGHRCARSWCCGPASCFNELRVDTAFHGAAVLHCFRVLKIRNVFRGAAGLHCISRCWGTALCFRVLRVCSVFQGAAGLRYVSGCCKSELCFRVLRAALCFRVLRAALYFSVLRICAVFQGAAGRNCLSACIQWDWALGAAVQQECAVCFKVQEGPAVCFMVGKVFAVRHEWHQVNLVCLNFLLQSEAQVGGVF
ncbi:hypothetical protein NDU88_002857 [Pleurodeles waltl]|uniref:Uncharacterized protein n=1 Tax=Pleurodeles waltl TaxID=8319 RepID=A0AAV7M1V3_PLEWA|nr:hypothetical protein NDU88_002857 [Pleurodeles waltl]